MTTIAIVGAGHGLGGFGARPNPNVAGTSIAFAEPMD